MVLLAIDAGGVLRRAPRREDGSQAIEFAMVLPLVTLLLALLGVAGVAGAEIVAAQGLAREAARTAAVVGVDEARARVAEAPGAATLEVDFTPARPRPGDVVTASVRVESRALASVGFALRIPARASMHVEGP